MVWAAHHSPVLGSLSLSLPFRHLLRLFDFEDGTGDRLPGRPLSREEGVARSKSMSSCSGLLVSGFLSGVSVSGSMCMGSCCI